MKTIASKGISGIFGYRFPIGIILIGLILVSGCATHKPMANQELANAVECGDPPQSMAVLPFINRTDTEGLEKAFRLGFYSNMTVHPYRDIELQEVDTRLKDNGLLENMDFTTIPVRELGRILGCDAVILGEVNNFGRIFLGVYSQLMVEGTINIWDTRSGKRIWTDRYIARKHEGGLPLDVLDLPLITVRAGMNLRDTILDQAIDDLCETLISNIPAPACVLTVEEGKLKYAYQVQVGAYLQREHAYRLKEIMEQKGYAANVRSNWDDRGLWHRVFLGSYEDKEVAIRLQKKIQHDLGAHAIIARVVLNEEMIEEESP